MNFHQGISSETKEYCFKWTMGVIDLDTISAPFTYTAFPPKEIKFAPLNLKVMGGEELSVI